MDETKRGRDLGAYLRQRVAQAFREGENTQVTRPWGPPRRLGREGGKEGRGRGNRGGACACARLSCASTCARTRPVGTRGLRPPLPAPLTAP